MADQQQKKSSGGDQDQPAHTDWLERTATVISVLIVATLFGLLTRDAVRTHSAADLEARAGDHRAVGSQHYMEVSVENRGDRAVRDVEIDISLVAGDSTDTARFTIDWLPGKSTRHGTAIFPRDPSAGTVRASVRGFAEP